MARILLDEFSFIFFKPYFKCKISNILSSKIAGLKEAFFQWLPENNRLERIWKLALIDFKRRYYNSFLGLFWALLNPLFRLTIYYFVFTIVLNPKIENYGLYLFLGLILWMFFSEGTSKSFSILRSKRYLLESIQFNKIDLFYTSVISVSMGFVFNLTVYLIFAVIQGVPFTMQILWAPLIVLNLIGVILGINMILGVGVIYLSDLQMLWTTVLLAGFWLTPIFYSRGALFDKFPALLYINPLAGIVINFRNVLLHGLPPEYFLFVYTSVYSLILVGIGVYLVQNFAHKAIEKL